MSDEFQEPQIGNNCSFLLPQTDLMPILSCDSGKSGIFAAKFSESHAADRSNPESL